MYLGFEQLHVIKQQNSDDFDDRLVIHKAQTRELDSLDILRQILEIGDYQV